jgi:DNA helicase-2/ATP-dependent DNA helicase PcrA
VDPADVLAGLDPEQRAVAEAVQGPVRVLAGAGTGKTRAITHRIAYAALTGAVPPGRMLAVTFTARAAGELRSRLRDLHVEGVQARTFHAAALRQLDYFWPRAIGGGRPRLVESKLRPLAEAAQSQRIALQRPVLRDVASEVEWAKATMVSPADYPARALAAHREPPIPAADVAKVYAAYEDLKRDSGLLDFEDMLLLTAALIEEHRDVATEVRERYRWFVVDEYQDVNPLQQRLLDAWLGGRDELCVVGDPEQTIYSFTGASPTYLLDFAKRFRNATMVELVRDYRSTPQVVSLANAVVGGTGLQLVAQRPEGPEPTLKGYEDEPQEAAAVARTIKSLVAQGVSPSRIAVLYRVNAQSEGYEQALTAAGIPYVLAGGERFFNRPEVRDAMRLLRGAARSTEAGEVAALVPHVVDVLSSTGWTTRPPAGTGAVREKWESLQALVGLAEELVAVQPGATFDEFVAELEERAAAQHAPTVEGVTLATFHAAKGLEWDAVFLVGLTDGTLPIVHAQTPAQVAEEKRLLYVGITRAERVLHLSWASSRAAGGRGRRRPSRFLQPLLPEADQTPAQRAAARRSAPKATPSGPVDPELFEALRTWRLEQARELGQPAFCVFTDATLEAIAALRPTTTRELVTVKGIGQSKLDKFGQAVLAICSSKPSP